MAAQVARVTAEKMSLLEEQAGLEASLAEAGRHNDELQVRLSDLLTSSDQITQGQSRL